MNTLHPNMFAVVGFLVIEIYFLLILVFHSLRQYVTYFYQPHTLCHGWLSREISLIKYLQGARFFVVKGLL